MLCILMVVFVDIRSARISQFLVSKIAVLGFTMLDLAVRSNFIT